MADRLGIKDIHADYRELCARSDIDAVTIVTPNAAHAAQAVAAFQHGKHVLCEKPLSVSVSEALGMLRAAEASGKIHHVAFTYRYLYGVRELRRLVRAGLIGEPYYVRIQYDGWAGLESGRRSTWRDCRADAGGGMLYDIGSHLFDVVRFLFGPFERITGFLHRVNRATPLHAPPVDTDDVAAAWFRHASGLRGQWFVSRATPPFVKNGWMEVVGPEGALRAALSRGSVDRLERSRPGHPDWEPLPLDPAAADGTSHCLGLMMRSFVDACLRGKLDGDIDASFHDGMAAQQALAAVESADRRLEWIDPSHPD
jgi:predicted dehydrogenase